MIEDVVILGAGASKAEGAPLQNELFYEYWAWKRHTIGQCRRFPEKHVDRLARFFDLFFGLDVTRGVLDKMVFPTFEEAIGILDLATTNKEEFIHWAGNPDRPEINRTRNDMAMLIAEILKERLRRIQSLHIKLVNNLRKKLRLEKTAFLSFNYDILINNALTRMMNHGIHLDYCINFLQFQRPDLFGGRSGWEPPSQHNAVKLFKIHGSLNWLYCPTCRSITLTPLRKGITNLITDPQRALCRLCHVIMRPMIVPPTFFKSLSNYFLQKIWKDSEDALRDAKRLVFCGYSFPDADIFFKYLLKRAEMNGAEGWKVFVINHHEGKSDETMHTEWERYRRFFGPNTTLKYLKTGFCEFAESPELINRKNLSVWKPKTTE